LGVVNEFQGQKCSIFGGCAYAGLTIQNIGVFHKAVFPYQGRDELAQR
jgi:hypothetical protein